MQAAGDLVAAAVAELAARVQHGEDDLDRRPAFLGMDGDRNAAPVIGDGHRVVGVDDHVDAGAVTGERLVDGVVDDLVDQVVQATNAGRADVHARSLANGLEPLEDGDVGRVVAGGRVPLAHALVVSHKPSIKRANAPVPSRCGSGRGD